MPKSEYLVVLDVGSSNVRTIISQIIPDEKPRIIGVGSVPSVGIRRGSVADLEDVAASIKESIETAEKNSGIHVESVYVSVGGNHIGCINAKGVIAVGRADGEVQIDDVSRVVDAAQAVSLPPNQEILYVVAQGFNLDNQSGIKDPIGMSGVRLEMEGLLIIGLSPHIKNLTKAVHNSGYNIEGFIVSPLAAANAVLNKRQKELGVAVVDIGGGTTSLSVFEEGELIHVSVIPVGASHITNDVAIGLRTSIDVAEKVKIEFGSALPAEISKKDQINLAEIDSGEEGSVSRHHVAEIIEARLEEIFMLVEKELKKIGRSALLPAGVVLTGGGACLQGSVDLAKQVLKLPAQTGFPVELSGLIDKVDNPSYSAAVGMILWVIDNFSEHQTIKPENRFNAKGIVENFVPMKETAEKIRKWMKRFLP